MKPLKPFVSPRIYFPGLISLILLPLASIVYIYFYQTKYAIPVHWFDKKDLELFSKWSGKKIDFEHFRNYSTLYLTGDEKHDSTTLNKLTEWADSFATKNDFKTGLRVVLTNRTKYQTLVTALDIGMRHREIAVEPYYDQIFLFKYQPRAVESLQGHLYSDVILIGDDLPDARSHYGNLTINSKELFYNVKSFWPCLIPFAGMILFWRKRNK